MNDATFKWADLPEIPKAPKKAYGKYHKVASELRTKPGRWGKLDGRKSVSMVHAVRHGTLKDFQPAGAYEAKVRGGDTKTGKGDIYVRYVGIE